jgi:hypothetical protein
MRRTVFVVALVLVTFRLHAQDGAVDPPDAVATVTDVPPTAATDAATEAATDAAAPVSTCTPDPLPADRAPQITVTLGPEQPRVGDRVVITYRFRYRARDRVEFEPDVVAFQQPAIEMDYARAQPERDRSARPAGDGYVTTDVSVAVQPFKVAEVVIASLPVRVNTGDEIARVCTPEVRFRVRSVFGNTAHPQPRDVTGPVAVRFGALTLRHVALALDGLFAVVLATLAVANWWRARPKVPPPPPPPRHPYLVAREALDALARGDLLSRGLTKDYYDAISDVIRRYLGGVLGFDAIEMTSDEVMAQVRKTPLPGVTLVELERLLSECDLVKFAGYLPSHEEADEILRSAMSIVERGRPQVLPADGARPGGAR